MISYTWTVTGVTSATIDGMEGVVTEVRFTAKAVDDADNMSAEYYGEYYLDAPDPANFSAYGSLTEQQVLDWCFAQNPKENILYDLQYMLNYKRSKLNETATAKQLPWSTVTEPNQ